MHSGISLKASLVATEHQAQAQLTDLYLLLCCTACTLLTAAVVGKRAKALSEVVNIPYARMSSKGLEPSLHWYLPRSQGRYETSLSRKAQISWRAV